MLNRRSLLFRAGAAGMAASGFPRLAAAALTKVGFALPSGACDCHVHVVGDPARYPMAANRVYTPPAASPGMLLDFQRALGFDRVVLIQPSFYGADNAAMLDAMRRLGPARARGVAVIDEAASESDLDAMRGAGIRGIRINLETGGVADPAVARDRLRSAIARCRPRGWHIQLYTRPAVIAALAGDLMESPAPVVLDHFAGARAASGIAQPGFDVVLAMVKSGKAYVKISAPYRVSALGPPYEDVGALARALVAANPERILWGSDWPHTDSAHLPGRTATDVTPFLPIDDGLVLNQLPRWAPDPALRRTILTDNPARLYGF